jgi:hypothetical protein
MDNRRLPEIKPKRFGKYRGIVTAGTDPTGKGRVKVQVPALFGFKELPNWADPVIPPQIIAKDQGGGKMLFDWESRDGNGFSGNGISGAGFGHSPDGSYGASTINISSFSTGAGTSTRKKLSPIIGAATDYWEVPAGSKVWIEFEGGDQDKPIWCGFWG